MAQGREQLERLGQVLWVRGQAVRVNRYWRRRAGQ